MRKRVFVGRLLPAVAVFVATAGVPLSVASESRVIPENAQAKRYGSGWECLSGFRKSGSQCVRLVIPANAIPTRSNFGSGWECRHGFTEVDSACQKVNVPENAYLDYTGDRWQCDREFRKETDRCVRVEVPLNAYLDESEQGFGWKCIRGYRPAADACHPVQVPDNAFPTYDTFGKGWECRRGYRDEGELCLPIYICQFQPLEENQIDQIPTGPTDLSSLGLRSFPQSC